MSLRDNKTSRELAEDLVDRVESNDHDEISDVFKVGFEIITQSLPLGRGIPREEGQRLLRELGQASRFASLNYPKALPSGKESSTTEQDRA